MKLNLNKPLIDFRGKEAIKIVNGKEQKQFLRDMVSEALYAAGMNPQSGNFSLQAKGYLIKNGKRDTPVCLITVAGNLFKIFKDIKEVANNVEHFGDTSSCSVYVKEIAVSGI